MPIPVLWEVAKDPDMRHVTQRGVAVAWPAFAHAVHVVVQDLRPDQWYWYRFRVGRDVSPVGRTR